MNKTKWLRQATGFAISLGCLGVIASHIHMKDLRQAVTGLHWQYLVLGTASLAIGYILRIVRWAMLLRAGGASVTNTVCAAPFLVSITLNNILPFRVGDIVRALVFPAALGVRRVTATASLVLERLIDMLSILACLGIGLIFSPQIELPLWLKDTVSTLSLAGGAAIILLMLGNRLIIKALKSLARHMRTSKRVKLANLMGLGVELLAGLAAMTRPVLLVSVAILSLLIWTAEAGLFLSLLTGFHVHAPLPAAYIVMAMATLSTLVPSAPGYVGTFHMAAFAGATLLGIASGDAASFALLMHLVLWLVTTIPGAVAAVINPDLFRKARTASVRPA